MTEKNRENRSFEISIYFTLKKREKFQISKFLEILKEKTRKTEVFEFYSIFKV